MTTTEKTLEILVLGDPNVGKTSLVLQFGSYGASPGAERDSGKSTARSVIIGTHLVEAQLWDTAEQERSRITATEYYRTAVGAFLVYDISDRSTFKSITRWLEELTEYAPLDCAQILIGNKSDLDNSRSVSTAEAKAFADEHNMHFIETSTQNGENLSQAFGLLLRSLEESYLFEGPDLIPNRYMVEFENGIEEREITTHLAQVEEICRRKREAGHAKRQNQQAMEQRCGWQAKDGCLESIVGSELIEAFELSEEDFTPASVPPECIQVEERFQWLDGVRGYIGVFDEQLLEFIKDCDVVSRVEKDSYNVSFEEVQENCPSWGVARISHQGRLQTDVNPAARYIYSEDDDGDGTIAYIIDTGIFIDHEDFEGRARWGTVIPRNATKKDFDGHGTHVAGTVGGKLYGVAKKTKLIAVKIFPDGKGRKGSLADSIKGLTWAFNDAKACGRLSKSVANISSGGAYSERMNRSVAAAIAGGLCVVVAAGNSKKNCSAISPASSPAAITVAETDDKDNFASFSNYGPLVNIFAPGKFITSCSNKATNLRSIRSGTSFATPHVSGVICRILSGRDVISPTHIRSIIRWAAERNVIYGELRNSPNLMTHWLGSEEFGPRMVSAKSMWRMIENAETTKDLLD